MMEYAEYLVRATVVWAVLCAYYRLVFRRAPFRWQRLYLWGALAAGFLIPVVPTLQRASEVMPTPVRRTIYAVLDLRAATEPLAAGSSVNWFFVVYLAGGIGLLALTLVQCRGLWQWFHEGHRERFAGLPVVRHAAVPSPLTAYGVIFLPAKLRGSDLERTALLHESAHLRLRHHVDAVLLQLICIICWFHPLIWLIRRWQTVVHEFEADALVLNDLPRITYGRHLLAAAEVRLQYPALFSSPLKSRIEMILNNPKRQLRPFYLILLLPVFAALLIGCSDLATPDAIQPNQSVVQAEMTTAVPRLATLDPGASDEDAQRALLEQIYSTIRYSPDARRKGAEGYVRAILSIDENGNCSTFDLRATDDPQEEADLHVVVVGYAGELNNSAANGEGGSGFLAGDVASTLMDLQDIGFQPYNEAGKAVARRYTLTFQFKLED